MLLAKRLACVLVAAAASESLAYAQTSDARRRFGLAWVRGEGAEACAPPSALVRGVRERLGYDPFSLEAPNTLEIRIRREGYAYSSEILVRVAGEGEPGSRTITSRASDCGPLVDALILAVALIVDPDAALEERAPPRPIAERPTEPRSVVVTSPVVAPSPAAPAWSTEVTLRGAIAFGFAPNAAPGIELAVKVLFRRKYALEVGALWVSETSGGDPSYRFGTTLGWIGGCRVISLGQRLYFDTCAEVWAGATHAVVFGRTPFEPGQRLLSAIALTPRLVWLPFPHVVVEGGGSGLLSWLKNEFRVLGQAEPIYTQPLVSGIGFLGAGIVF